MKESTGQETEGEGNENEINIVSEVDLIKAWGSSGVDIEKGSGGGVQGVQTQYVECRNLKRNEQM